MRKQAEGKKLKENVEGKEILPFLSSRFECA
jgi:hypothetical protein